MIKEENLVCDGCKTVLIEKCVMTKEDNCDYALCLDCGKKQLTQKRNKLNRQIATLKKANLQN